MSEKLGKNMSEFRKKRGITQRDLANVLGLSPSAIAMWETGKREPDLETLIKIADYFGVKVDLLLGVTEKSSGENRPITKADEDVRSLARDFLSLDSKSQGALLQIVKTMQKRGKEALDE